MKLTKLEEQGLRLAMCLAREGRQLTLSEISEREQLSEALVASVLNKLRRGGVVEAFRGRRGGYTLARDPSALSVAEVLTSFGRPLLHGCFNRLSPHDDEPCVHAEACGLRPVWEQLEDELSRVLNGVTVADLLQREDAVREHVARFRHPDATASRADATVTDHCRCGHVSHENLDAR